jgi:hypothetical protein
MERTWDEPKLILIHPIMDLGKLVIYRHRCCYFLRL